MADYISLAGFILAVFVFGIAVGKLIAKIERFIDEKEDYHRNSQKNDRRQSWKDLNDSRFKT